MKLFITLFITYTTLFAGVFDFQSISSDFKQTITNEENTKIIYEGSLYASTNSKALWIYKKPVDKKIYFNQKQVVIIEPELEQVIITNLDNVPNLTQILRSSTKIDKNNYQATYDSMKYDIKINNDIISSISYQDKLENSIVIELFNQEVDTFIDDVLFEAIIPDGYDVLMQ